MTSKIDTMNATIRILRTQGLLLQVEPEFICRVVGCPGAGCARGTSDGGTATPFVIGLPCSSTSTATATGMSESFVICV